MTAGPGPFYAATPSATSTKKHPFLQLFSHHSFGSPLNEAIDDSIYEALGEDEPKRTNMLSVVYLTSDCILSSPSGDGPQSDWLLVGCEIVNQANQGD
jgi:hypothetical protein